MPNVCKLCRDEHKAKADALIIAGKSNRSIAGQFGIGQASVQRHRQHVGEALLRAKERRELKEEDAIMVAQTELVRRAELLWDACHEYLLDPERPGKYNIGARAAEIDVIYEREEQIGKVTKKVRKRDTLAHLIEGLEGVVEIRYNHSDPRRLILTAIERLESLLNLEARLTGRMKEGGVVVNQQVNYYLLMPVVMGALRNYPEAQQAVIAAANEHLGQISSS